MPPYEITEADKVTGRPTLVVAADDDSRICVEAEILAGVVRLFKTTETFVPD